MRRILWVVAVIACLVLGSGGILSTTGCGEEDAGPLPTVPDP